MNGHELNAIYNGYTFLPLYLGYTYATSFSHLHDYEPAPLNHIVPHYGIFSKFYCGRMIKSCLNQGVKYSSFKKNHGPPFYSFNPRYMPVEHNDYLKHKGVSLKEVRMFEPKSQIAIDHHDAQH